MKNEQLLNINDEFIRLGQAMKLAGLVSSGTDAKILIQEGRVKVDGEVDMRRGRKMYDGMVFEFENNTVRIVSPFKKQPCI